MSRTKWYKTDQDETKATEENSSSDKPSTSKGLMLKGSKERHQHALKRGHLTDVTFSVGPKKTLFHAHKMILSLATPVFEAMFHGPLREVGERIEITDIDPIGFQLLLDYIYTDDLKFNNESEAFATWIAADKYYLPHVADLCFKYLSQCNITITDTNVWTVLEHSLLLNFSLLVNKCYRYLKTDICIAMGSPRFVDISSEILRNILLMPVLNIDEITLLRGIVFWAQKRIKPGSDETVAQLLKPFMEYIRFGCMSQLQFVTFIDEYPDVISDSDTVKILKYMTNDNQYSLPKWCSIMVSSRKTFEKHPKYVSNILRNNIRAHCSSAFRDHPDNELYQGYHNSDNLDISSNSDSRSRYSCSSPHSESESMCGYFSEGDISSCSNLSSLSSSSD